MKLRIVLVVLSLLAVLSTLAGAYLFLSTRQESAVLEIESRAATMVDRVTEHLTAHVQGNLAAVKALAGLQELRNTLINPDQANLTAANLTLDHFRDALSGGVCYLINADGLTVASSNRHQPDSFVGHNYGFRPYFQEARQGRPTVYLALGTVSRERGIYCSHPVYGETQAEPLGVAVIKGSLKALDPDFKTEPGVILVFTDPTGVVFLSSRPDWLFMTLWPLKPEIQAELTRTNQFGPGPWEWLGLVRIGNKRVRDKTGREYLFHQRKIEDQPEGSVVFLSDMDEIASDTPGSFQRYLAVYIALLGLLIGGAVSFLYRLASEDIRRRQAAEKALLESEELFRSIVENSHEGILMADEAFHFIYVNDELCSMLGYTRQELTGQDFRRFLDEESRSLVAGNYLKRQRGEPTPSRYEFNVVRQDGRKRRVEISSALIRDSAGQPRTVSQILDVTKRRAAEEALRESEEKFRTLLDSIEEGYFEVDLKGRLTYANDSFCRIMGYGREEMIGHSYKEFTSPRWAEITFRRVNEIFRTGQAAKDHLYEILTKDGSLRVLQGAASLLRDKSGQPLGFRGVAHDVTESKRAEEALRESEEKFRTVMEANPDPVILYDEVGRVLYFNPAFTRVFGWTLEERLGQMMDQFVPAEEWDETWANIERLKAGESFIGFETRRYTKSGETIPVSISAASYQDREGRLAGAVVTIRDVRSRMALEAQLLHAQKMQAIGTLTSGIAHDFNNLLQAISGSVQLLMSRAKSDDQDVKYLTEIDQTVARASDLVQRLLTFGRKAQITLKPLNLNHEIRQAVAMLERTIPKMVAIETRLAADLKPINGDATQLAQVLLNLASNAKDAMPDGGRLIFETDNVTLTDEQARPSMEIQPGEYARLIVTDTGHGLDQETLAHIFEPFFTTKPLGAGAGLGLSLVYGIIKAHGGHITCRGRPGQGAVFELLFPAGQVEAAVPVAAEGGPETLPGGEETILLVDDEMSIREVTADFLESLGYRVLQADSGEKALEIYQNRPEAVDLVVLDLGMPGMGGYNCLRELIKVKPTIRTIIASGYSADLKVKEALAAGARGFLGKPYRLKDLIMMVREILDKPE
ncbi:MAG: PAS domain S-box protein [Thermodesulfobacteriota bacterium]